MPAKGATISTQPDVLVVGAGVIGLAIGWRAAQRAGLHEVPIIVHEATDAEALGGIYESIDLEFKRVDEPREVTALFAAGGGLLLALGSVLSILWFGRVI